ncbi:MAG: sensor histidine kinase [Planctomycetes bacterium]|nr:sensor histidine kinase [Planctomycetota bacterium]
MKRRAAVLPARYRAALLAHLKRGRGAGLEAADGLGAYALSIGLQTLDLARFHEHVLVTEVLPGCASQKRAALIRSAGAFFAAAIMPLEKTRGAAGAATAHLKRLVGMLSQRTVELAAANVGLTLEVAQRKAVEVALKRSERHYAQLLRQSDHLQGQLRHLSRQILSAQEDERRKISRELHDVIAQTLTGINLRLATLKAEASSGTKGLEENIVLTQELVQKSVNLVHQFARELRPAVLDDLGLIPALHAFMKTFTARTGVRAHLTAFAGVEALDMDRRTVLFRVVQEALTNVGRHAKATRVEVAIKKVGDATCCLRIEDDGRSFNIQRILLARSGRRLGLLGMRERIEMVGGSFSVASAAGTGTVITAEIPLGKVRRSRSSRGRTAVCT